MSGLYTGASGMIANMLKLNTHSNNLANVSTNGFKKDQETFRVFDETMKKSFTKDGESNLGGYYDEVYADTIQTYFEEGAAKSTNNELDFMLTDKNNTDKVSFFTVQLGDEQLLTRNGGFTLDANRTLATVNGGKVLDINNNPVVIPKDAKTSINAEGLLFDEKTGKEIAKLKLQSVNQEDLQLLEKREGGYFDVMSYEKIENHFGNLNQAIAEFDRSPTIQSTFGTKERLQNIAETGQVDILDGFSGSVQGNTIELSNVEMPTELVGLMNAQKGINSNQKVTSTMDKIFEKEANQIAK